MSKSVLLICQSCNASHANGTTQSSQGSLLLDRLAELHQDWSRQAELEIQPERCLWACDHPCVIALSCPGKLIYVLAQVPVTESSASETAASLLRLSEEYLDRKDGNIPWNKFPEVLQTDIVARIPPTRSIPIHNP